MSEKLYDDVIAPKLLEIAKLCKDAGMPMLATVWFEGDDSGSTRVFPEGPHSSFRLMYIAQQCRGNLDQLCFALAREIHDGARQSLVLLMLKRNAI